METDEDLDHLDIPLVSENADTVVIGDKEKDRVRLGQFVMGRWMPGAQLQAVRLDIKQP